MNADALVDDDAEPLSLPTYEDVQAAARRLDGHAHRTPVMRARSLEQALGLQVFFKCENLQRAGAFKFRGAFHALSRFDAAQRRAGVLSFSSGNHAQAIALSARLLDLPAMVVMPSDAPASKMAATQAYGAQVHLYDRYREDREAICHDLARQRGMTVIPPFDHADVIAGQGTAAKELFDEVGPLDALFVCLGGGGLLAGSALAAQALAPACKVYGVEPAAGNDGQLSWHSGRRVKIDTPATIADGAQTQQLGRLTFAVMRQTVADIDTVADADLVEGMRFYASRMKLFVEPTGCLSLAGLWRRAADWRGARVGVIISGGNVDLDRFCSLAGSSKV